MYVLRRAKRSDDSLMDSATVPLSLPCADQSHSSHCLDVGDLEPRSGGLGDPGVLNRNGASAPVPGSSRPLFGSTSLWSANANHVYIMFLSTSHSTSIASGTHRRPCEPGVSVNPDLKGENPVFIFCRMQAAVARGTETRSGWPEPAHLQASYCGSVGWELSPFHPGQTLLTSSVGESVCIV